MISQLEVLMNQEYKLSPNKLRKFPGMDIFWKRTASAEFQVITKKSCGNCTFPQKVSAPRNQVKFPYFHVSLTSWITNE